MLNFILCDDDKNFCSKVKEIINKYMLKTKYEYKIHTYYDYDSSFEKIVKSKISFKIYILDIETPSSSGIDIVRKIRKDDINSVIIFLTGHEELGLSILKNEFCILTLINKFDDCEERLKSSISKSLQIINKKTLLRIKERNITYTFNLESILYIAKDSIERKTILNTDYGEYKINKTLKEIASMIDGRFVKTHRACYVNMDRVLLIDKKNKKITFDNKSDINLLSDIYEGVK